MIEWNDASVGRPTKDGEYLCFVRIPKRDHGPKRNAPEHFRYMTLEFAEGVFWINNGAPEGFVLFWTDLNPPLGHTPPPVRQRKVDSVKRQVIAVDPNQLDVTAEEDEAFGALNKNA